MTEQKQRGEYGEAVVADHLRQQGYHILETQFRTRYGEIDIVAHSPEGILCFVEVKTRKNASFAHAREAVTLTKQRRIRATAQRYLCLHGDMDTLCRFDVAEVYVGNGTIKPRLQYIIQAFT